MATYYSTRMIANGSNTSRPIASPGHGHSNNLKVFYFEVTFTAAWTSSDTTYLGFVPNGFRFLGTYSGADDMDSGTTLTWDIGDSGDQDRLVAAQTTGQTNSVSFQCRAQGTDLGFGYKYTADTLITATPVGSPATTTGTIKVALLGIIEGVAS